MKLLKHLPFITREAYILHGKRVLWFSRMHRKGLYVKNELLTYPNVPFWKTQSYNHRIGVLFAVGAFLFGLASVFMFMSLKWPDLGNLTNVLFFVGSLPFTCAATLQHLQSANMALPESAESKQDNATIALIGWYPKSAGWVSTLAQLLGTLAFNISTFNSIASPTQPALTTLEIWAPNFEGSVLFLISGYLAFIEVGNRYWSWMPKKLYWQIAFINLLGCIFFMISAVTPITPQADRADWVWLYSNTYTLLGAICFFISAVLSVYESRTAAPG